MAKKTIKSNSLNSILIEGKISNVEHHETWTTALISSYNREPAKCCTLPVECPNNGREKHLIKGRWARLVGRMINSNGSPAMFIDHIELRPTVRKGE